MYLQHLPRSNDSGSSFRASNKSGLNKTNAPRHKNHLILKAVELHGRDWKMVLAFSKLELGVLGEEGELYHDCDINNGSVQGPLRKLAPFDS